MTEPRVSLNPMDERNRMLDLIRLASMLPVSWFHVGETILYMDRHPFGPAQSINAYIYPIFLPFAFSGHTVLALSAFLYGARERSVRSWLLLLGFLAVALVILSWVEADGAGVSFQLEWDIYPFLLVAFLSLFLAQFVKGATSVLGVLGLGIMWVPFWQLIPEPERHSLWFDALVGTCAGTTGGGGWPLLPWIGLPWMFYAWGSAFRKSQDIRRLFASWTRTEQVIWGLGLSASLLTWRGAYFGTPYGPGFACVVFRQPLWGFWGHLIWPVFLLRISWLPQVRSWCERQGWMSWVSNLAWSRKFGRCYLVHLVWLGIFSLYKDFLLAHPRVYDAIILFILPLTEVSVRVWIRMEGKPRRASLKNRGL